MSVCFAIRYISRFHLISNTEKRRMAERQTDRQRATEENERVRRKMKVRRVGTPGNSADFSLSLTNSARIMLSAIREFKEKILHENANFLKD